MATIAFDSSDAPARPPISTHPAFPAIVALWFAVLLGLGTLALPVVLLERVVNVSGIASLVSAAGPPLGTTARGLIALAAALLGAGLGVWLARRVAANLAPGAHSRAATVSGGLRAPLSIRDELGEDGLVNGEALPLSRRRALAISDDDRADDHFYDVPLPSEDDAAIAPSFDEGDEPLELSKRVEDNLAHAFPPGFADEPVADEDLDMTGEQEFEPTLSADPFDMPEPLAFSAPSLGRRLEEPACDDGDPGRAVPAAVMPSDEPEADWQWADAPLEELGLDQLVDRLGSTIERRRERLAETGPARPAVPMHAPTQFEAAPAAEAEQAMAAYFGGAAEPEIEQASAEEPEPDEAAERVPGNGLRPTFLGALQLAQDEDEDEDAFPELSLPPRGPLEAGPALGPAIPAEGEEEEGEDVGAGYSSLLGMSGPFAQPTAEFEEFEQDRWDAGSPEPVEPSASEGAPRPFDPRPEETSPANADAALRTALATLQRMSGAA